LIALLVASLVIAFFVLRGWKRDVQRTPTWNHLRRNETHIRVLLADNEGEKFVLMWHVKSGAFFKSLSNHHSMKIDSSLGHHKKVVR
jgi:hypothetical protein